MPNQLPQWQEAFLERHQLPLAYLGYAQEWFAPLAKDLAEHRNSADRPLLVALNGCQGSGKTTVCDYLLATLLADFDCPAVALSLDDFYLTHKQRQRLADSVDPLLATRGVPGTHDMQLLKRTLDALLAPTASGPVAIPRFDKGIDDRRPQASWDRVDAPVDLVLLEGWCLGARPQTPEELVKPVNALERDEDPHGHWRAYANSALQRDFEPLYRRVDQWVMLRAPDFACVYRWRLEQEQKLAATAPARAPDRIMDSTQLSRFIQHYQRLTDLCLAQLPARVDHLYVLDEQRQVTAREHPRRARP